MDRGRTDSLTHGPDRCGEGDCTGDQRRAVVAVIFMIASIAVPALVWVDSPSVLRTIYERDEVAVGA
jgi:hypothetical protein